jgi:prepilin-type N-terminal cleavage/methylation domain-containing protein
MRLNADNKGFTLIEILVVLALTIMVMGLIFGPLIQTFKITRQAETMIRAQDNARMALSQVSQDLSNAMYVYDNTRDSLSFPVVDSSGTPVTVQALYAKVDMVLPRMRGYCTVSTTHTPGGIQRGDEAAPRCPVCGQPLELKPIEPLVPDTTIVRYFIGLKDPSKPYFNGYETKLTHRLAAAEDVDNTYVLYRVEFNPADPTDIADLFPDDVNGDGLPDTVNDRLSYAGFFYDPAHASAWRRRCRPVVTLNDIDLITVEYDANGAPIVTPTVKFAPTAIYNDPLVPTTGANEEPDRGEAPPTRYKASYGHWVLPYKITLDSDDQPGVVYETMPGLGTTGPQDPPTDMCIYKKSGGNVALVFNITHYLNTKSDPAIYSGARYGFGEMWPSNIDDREKAFTVDTMKGTVNCAFPNCYQTYCDTLNTQIGTALGGDITLSQLASSGLINQNPDRVFVINAPDAPDPRVFSNGTVVLGSVKVIAPDALRQQTAPLVQYTRTAFLTQDPGPDQFTVDANSFDPSYGGAAAIYFHVPHPAAGTAIEDHTFPPDNGVNDVLIYYEVQNNRKGDLLRANYVTKDLMTVIMGIRIYDSNSGRLQFLQLTNKMRLKNIAD